MTTKAYPVLAQVAGLRLVDLPLPEQSARIWQVVCSYAFEATWNGGPDATDIDIRFDQAVADEPGFVRSSRGEGLLTFDPGYQFKTDQVHLVWVRGPINWPKDGVSPLERVVGVSTQPCAITVDWQFTRPNHTVRFEAGEPFGALVVHVGNEMATPVLEVVDLDEDVEDYRREFLDQLGRASVKDVVQRLDADTADVPAQAVPALVDRPLAPRKWAGELTEAPPVSCICPTYARVELLEEAICSFLQQDYPGEKELIILNDYAEQTLQFDHPDVRVINLPTRFHSIGEKYNAAVALCSHDLICVWHDDDLSLPHRLSFSVANLDKQRGFFKAERAWFWNNGELSGPETNVFHGASCWSRDLFVATRGYPHVNARYDAGFEERCEEEQSGQTRATTARREDLYYVYRWNGTASYHLSACAAGGDELSLIASYVHEKAAQGEIRHGRIELNPHWNMDYSALVQDYLASLPTTPVEEEAPFPPPLCAITAPPPMPDDEAAALFSVTHPARISVILPALNESVLLQRTVEQFEATLPPCSEIIVVDNGSTDGSADFLELGEHPTVSLVRTASRWVWLAHGAAGWLRRAAKSSSSPTRTSTYRNVGGSRSWRRSTGRVSESSDRALA